MDNIGVLPLRPDLSARLRERYHVSQLISKLHACFNLQIWPSLKCLRKMPDERGQNLTCSRQKCCGAADADYD
jgi:hypothetical protein